MDVRLFVDDQYRKLKLCGLGQPKPQILKAQDIIDDCSGGDF